MVQHVNDYNHLEVHVMSLVFYTRISTHDGIFFLSFKTVVHILVLCLVTQLHYIIS